MSVRSRSSTAPRTIDWSTSPSSADDRSPPDGSAATTGYLRAGVASCRAVRRGRSRRWRPAGTSSAPPRRPRFPQLLGLSVEDVRDGYCRMRLPFRAELLHAGGVVHGGALASLLDSVLVPAIGVSLPAGRRLLDRRSARAVRRQPRRRGRRGRRMDRAPRPAHGVRRERGPRRQHGAVDRQGDLHVQRADRLMTTLSERASKELLARVRRAACRRSASAVDADGGRSPPPSALGFPVVAQAERRRHRPQDRAWPRSSRPRRRRGGSRGGRRPCSPRRRPDDGDVELLVAPMIAGRRELIAGAVRDPQFGPTVMLGVGGVLAEAIDDVVFRPAPLDRDDGRRDDRRPAHERRCSGRSAARQRSTGRALAAALVALGRVITERDDVASVDVNPLIIDADGRPVAVDALVELRSVRPPVRPRAGAGDARRPSSSPPCSSRAVSSSPERRRTPASSGSCRCTTCWRRGTPGRSTAPT